MPNRQKSKLPLYLFLALAAAAILFAAYYLYKTFKYYKEPVPAAVEINQVISKNAQQTPGAITEQPATPEIKNLPAELNLDVPFYAQAPFGNWDYPWQEACEEASILLVANAYYQHNWTATEFNDQILKLVDWENQHFGYYKDTPVAQIVIMLNQYLNLKTIVHENPTLDDVKTVLAQGHLIVMTFDGKKLFNPNFKNGGPIYHALVIKGYKEGDKIITNDVGTHNGADYVYDWSTLQNAMHDYTTPIDDGAKRMIEILPPEQN